MKILDLEQGSPEWLEWRKGIITATDAPKILGNSPYGTSNKCWQNKLGLIPEQKSNSAMERGKRDEPIARAMFEKHYKMKMNPCCIESEKYNFLGASLDGLSECGKYILEIKSNGDQYHDYLYTRGIPIFHTDQVQHQILCGDGQIEKAFYLSYNNTQMEVIEVLPSGEWSQNFIPIAKEFWSKVIFQESPALCEKDYRDLTPNRDAEHHALQYDRLSQEIKALEDKKNFHREALIKICGNDNCVGYGVKIFKKLSKGRIDYDAIPEIQTLNLDKFRKPSSESWTILVDKKSKE